MPPPLATCRDHRARANWIRLEPAAATWPIPGEGGWRVAAREIARVGMAPPALPRR